MFNIQLEIIKTGIFELEENYFLFKKLYGDY